MPAYHRIDASKRRNDLLREHHLEWIASNGKCAIQQPREMDLLWLRPDGVAHIDVYVQVNRGTRQCPVERDANRPVLIVVSDGLCGRMLGIEDESDVDLYGGDLADQAEQVRGAILESTRGQVDVARRPADVQSG